MFVYIAGLKAIPYELVEAARVEGASSIQVLRRVKLPLLAPAFTFNITLTLIGALYIFDVVLAMTRGGPGRATEVLNMVVWRQFGTGAFGYATAFSTVLLIVILLVAVPLIFYLRRREVEL
jgi:raffinose/stachyose/melibiose transport system permease protein